MDTIGICIIFLGLVFLLIVLLQGSVLGQGSGGLTVIFGKRSFFVCRYTADDFLGPWSFQILDRRGQVFLADRNEIRRLKKRGLRTCLSKDELEAAGEHLCSYEKICVVRNHKLADRVRERLAWEDKMRGNWPQFPKSPERRKDEIIASPV